MIGGEGGCLSLDLSAQIAYLRNRNGLTQSEVARRMHVDVSITHLWEHGKRLVPRDRLSSLAAALETTVETLTGRTPAPERPGPPEWWPTDIELAAMDATLNQPWRQTPPVARREVSKSPFPAYPLRWCMSTHGALDAEGNPPPARRHHHGPRSINDVPGITPLVSI